MTDWRYRLGVGLGWCLAGGLFLPAAALRSADAISHSVAARATVLQQAVQALVPGRPVDADLAQAAALTQASSLLTQRAAPPVQVSIETYDAGGLKSAVERKLIPALLEALRANRGGALTQLRVALARG